MALRSPVPFHNFWGATFANAGFLPNTPGNIVMVAPLNLEAGDFAYVTGDSTFYVCTSPGTVNNGGDAIWVQITTGAAGIDRFAPKHLVGFAPGGDPAADFSANGFYYWADDGSGNGIRAALLAASPAFSGGSAISGDVWVRPGTYTLPTNDPALVVPADTRVQGAGATTLIQRFQSDAGESYTVFELQNNSELRDLAIRLDAIVFNANPGDAAVSVTLTPTAENPVPSRAHVERLTVTVNDTILDTSPHNLAAFYVPALCSLEADRCDVTLTGTGYPDGGDNILAAWRSLGAIVLDACRSTGGDAAVQSVGSEQSPSEASIDQCSFRLFTSIGVISSTGNLSVTGATVIESTDASTGILADAGTLIVNAKITLANTEFGTQRGIDANVSSGQVFGSRVEASNGIVSASVGPAGLAIGFNNVISATAHITSTAFDEVAHNILT